MEEEKKEEAAYMIGGSLWEELSLWRKNRSRARGLVAICEGVDLNRNFGFKWGEAKTISIQAGSNLACVETYAGPGPFSEPETRNIANFVASIQQKQTVMVSDSRVSKCSKK